ncbi:OmpL47-type beta-barrel domain-containing protein [Paenisporosarcina sp.]|uniref:OmpL47-type beta-barrel domain-containing protein n=1 Tax=Paenisporosarcina sp. TaxID=1932001 RepID=UPI003C727B49
MRKYSQISLLLSILLVLQLVLPTISVFAASTEAPTNLQVTVNNGNNFLLKWTEVSSAQKYNVYQVIDGEKKLIGSPTNTAFGFSNKPEGDYVFEVTAFNTATGESVPSTQVAYTLVHPKMAAPQDLSLTIRNGNDLFLKWTASDFAASYNIYQIKDGVKKLAVNTANLSRNFSNMPAGEYVYEVTAVSDRFGESQTASRAEIVLVHPVMVAPADLTLSIRNGNDINLKWPEVEYATAYNIYEVKAGVKKLVNTTENSTRTLTNKPSGDYQYEVYAVSSRFGESKTAAQASTTLVHPVMAAPSVLTVSTRNGNDLFLKWSEVEFATGYNIYQINNGTKKFLYTTENISRSFTNLPAGTYQYEVTSISDRFGESKSGVQANYSLVHPELAAPTDLRITVQNGNDLAVRWSEVEFATSYNVYQIKDDKKELVANTANLSRTFTNMPEDWYEYEVTAVSDRFGESSPSNVEYTLGHPTVQSPELKLLSFDEQTATLNWKEIVGASVYNVYEVINGEYVLIDSTDKRTYTVNNITDGKHEYVVTVTHSRFGDSSYSNAVVVEMQNDLTPPVTSSNANDTWLNQDFVMELIAEDDKSGVASTFYSFDGVDFKEGTNFTVSESGIQKISFYSTDLAGNVEEVKTAQVKIDKIAPETTTNANGNWHQEFTVKFTAEDAQSGVEKTFYSVNGSEFTQGESVVVNEEGINSVSFYSTDLAGNVEEVKTAEVKIDLTAPETISNADADWHQEFAVELTATDDKAGVETTFHSVNGAEFKEGSSFVVTEDGINTISFYSVDQAGNIEEAKTTEVKIDKSAPETVSNADSEWHQEFTVELTATDDKSTVAKTFYSVNGAEFAEGTVFKINKDGINKIEFYSVNKAGGVEEVKTAEVKIDRTAPETEASESTDWQTEAIVELTATDDKSGVDKTFFTVNGSDYTEGTSVSVTEAGVNVVSFYSVDKVGNKEEVKTIEVSIDGIAPETVSNADDQWYQEFTVELTATDNHSGVDKTFYSVNGSEFEEGTNFTVSEEGINVISFYSVDYAGNVEEVKTAEVKIDRTAPETVSNADDKWRQEFTVELTATDEHSGVAQTFYSLNGSEFVEGTSFEVTEEGINTISFYSVDHAGNVEEVKTAEVKIDTAAPVTISNADDQWHQEFAVELTATDTQSGVAQTFYSVNGSEFTEGTSFTVIEEGINVISFYSVDHAGNQEEVKTAEVKIDFSAPETISNIEDKWLKEEFAVELTATDILSGVASTSYSVNGSEFTEGTSFTVSEEGINEVQFFSTDIAGNKEEAKTSQVKIDKTAPEVSWTLDGEGALGSKMPITYVASDALSGIASEKLTVNGVEVANGETVSFDQPGEYKIQVTVTDQAGWTTELEHTMTVYIPLASFKVMPGVIKGNSGVFSVEVNLPKGFDTKDFVLETVTINGVSAISGKNGFSQQAKNGHFRFNREDFKWVDGKQLLEFRGMVGGHLVIGQATVETKGSKK